MKLGIRKAAICLVERDEPTTVNHPDGGRDSQEIQDGRGPEGQLPPSPVNSISLDRFCLGIRQN